MSDKSTVDLRAAAAKRAKFLADMDALLIECGVGPVEGTKSLGEIDRTKKRATH